MAYIGKSPSNGVRNRFQYQATAGQQTFSNADANGLTLTYTDSLYMDVYQNGILLVPGDDYTATTGTTVVLVQAASLNDIVEMVVYDVFSVNDSVSASSGGTFSSAVTFGGGVVVANGGNIGSASDTDAMSISSGGVVTFTQNTVGAGGMDLLLDATLTTSLGNIDISSTYINSTYDDYLLLFNLDPDEDDRHLYIQVFVGGSALGGDVYAYEAALLSGNEYENDNHEEPWLINKTDLDNYFSELKSKIEIELENSEDNDEV